MSDSCTYIDKTPKQPVIPDTRIVWEGISIACLGICTGDSLSSAEISMANAICDLMIGLDISSITATGDMLARLTVLGEHTLVNFLTALMGASNDLTTALGTLQGTLSTLEVPTVTLPTCFGYMLQNPCDVSGTPSMVELVQQLLIQVCKLMQTTYVPQYTTVLYRGSLSNFDITGIGLINTPVYGWKLCNGQNGTPLSTALPQNGASTFNYIMKAN